MILVTGHAGFIAGHLMRRLPQAVGCDKDDDIADLLKMGNWEAVFHLGAISDTTCEDAIALSLNNMLLPARLWAFCADRQIPFIYASSASVYGNGDGPLNPYAKSKLDFDRVAEVAERCPLHWYGLRFFNVYGPGEDHKGKQASMVHQLIERGRKRQPLSIFAPDAQRDFIHVDDVVNVMLWLWKNRPVSGIYDVGTGRPCSFMAMARIVAEQFAHKPDIGWSNDIPANLAGKYQFHTQADLSKLRDAGYHAPFLSLEEGVARMIDNLRRTHNHRN